MSSVLVTATTFQVLNRHMWSMATVSDNADYKTFPSSQKVLSARTALEPG